MNEGMPILATSTPLMNPTKARRRRATPRDGDPAEMVFLEQDREDEAGERNDRGKAEVDLARRDDEGETGGEQHKRRQRRQERRVDERPQKDGPARCT